MQLVLIRPEQSRAARALLNFSTADVQRRTGLGINTIQRFERGQTNLNMDTLQKLVAAYNRAGVVFPDGDTVRLLPRDAADAAA